MSSAFFSHRHDDGEVEQVAIEAVPTLVLQQSGTTIMFEVLARAGALLDIDEELRRRGAPINTPPAFIQVLFEAVREVRAAGDAPVANTLPV